MVSRAIDALFLLSHGAPKRQYRVAPFFPHAEGGVATLVRALVDVLRAAEPAVISGFGERDVYEPLGRRVYFSIQKLAELWVRVPRA